MPLRRRFRAAFIEAQPLKARTAASAQTSARIALALQAACDLSAARRTHLVRVLAKAAPGSALFRRAETIGVGAASLALRADGSGERATNVRKARDYLAGAAPETTSIPPDEMAGDRAWLGMRTSDGVLERQLSSATVTWLLAEGLADRRGERICPTLRGFLMADRIEARIVAAL